MVNLFQDKTTSVKNIIFTFTIGLLFCCSSRDNSKNESQTSTNNFKTKDTTISFSGYWLSEDYYNNIKNFKSPKEAQDNSEFIFIPHRTLKPTMMIANFHEGGPSLTILKYAEQFQLWEMQGDSLTEHFNNIEILNESKIKICDRNFIKITPVTKDNGSLILEEILFKGTYTNARGESIEFKNNGQVIGLDNFESYLPNIDYFDAGMQVDQVGFSKSQKDPDWFGFKFTNDTLNIYKLNCLTYDSTDNRCVEVGFGQLAYKLWRKI